jgi:hypothetical protein
MKRLLRDFGLVFLGALAWGMLNADMNKRADETAALVLKEAPRPVGHFDPQRKLSWPVGKCPDGIQEFTHWGPEPKRPVRRCVDADLRTSK